jgi:hypothetical protein
MNDKCWHAWMDDGWMVTDGRRSEGYCLAKGCLLFGLPLPRSFHSFVSLSNRNNNDFLFTNKYAYAYPY